MTQHSASAFGKTPSRNPSTSNNLISEAQLPNQLTSAEYQELYQGSGIHPDLIQLNFFHLEGQTALDRLFISEQLKRTNSGAVSYSILKRYRHIEAGGWWVSGVDVLNKYHDDLWGQFKPLQPRLSVDKGKIIKYEGPPKHPSVIISGISGLFTTHSQNEMGIVRSRCKRGTA